MAVEEHLKGWGKELWIANSELYCGKKLVLTKGKKCSVHFHKKKDETFFVQAGLVEMRTFPTGFPGEQKTVLLKPGDNFHIPVGTIHQFFGIEDSEIFEFSTQHFEEDSHRLAPGDSQK
ncbi:cupin domain-containing protein [Candidatus Woesearchaeota archaeon]|nr:cupin domain-containing protein [Candidatus Woesearchaeota archaeon]